MSEMAVPLHLGSLSTASVPGTLPSTYLEVAPKDQCVAIAPSAALSGTSEPANRVIMLYLPQHISSLGVTFEGWPRGHSSAFV